MSSSIPGHGTALPGSRPRSSPVATVSRSVLARNARVAAGRGIHSYDSSVLRGDAWGHGSTVVREVLAAEGFSAGAAGLSPETLFGLPGGEPQSVAALRLTGTVLSVKILRAGEGVSYGYAYRASRDTRIALVTGGYAQGIVRALGNRADVMVAGERHPIVGRVAMDVCVVEIADAELERGDDVLLLGDHGRGEPCVAEWAEATGLLAAELITAVGLRAMREVAP